MNERDAINLYASWAAPMMRYGGEISALPNDPSPLRINGYPFPRITAVFRDPQVWGKLVNAKTIPVPTQYGGNGKIAYYVAPANVQAAHVIITEKRIQANADAATQTLLDKWGVPTSLQSVGNFLGGLRNVALIAAIFGVVWIVSKSRGGFRSWA